MRNVLLLTLSAALGVACLTSDNNGSNTGGTVITYGPGPTITSFSATPRNIESGEPVRLEWEVDSAESITIYDGDGKQVFHGNNNVGTHTVSPQKTDTYTLLASNVRGENRATLSVEVEVHLGAEILNFACTPMEASHGDQMEITWEVKRPTEGLEIYAGEQLIHLSSAKRGWFQYVPRATTEFKLIALNSEGNDEALRTCIVLPSPPAIREFFAQPSPAPLFGTTELKWEAYGASTIRLERVIPDPRVFPTSDVNEGSLTVSVNHPSSQYKVTVQNAQGETSRVLVLAVTDPEVMVDKTEESEPNESIAVADDTTLSAAGTETVWGRMYPRGDFDFWRFTVPEGQRLAFDAWLYGQAGVLTSCNGDTVLSLHNAQGMMINQDDNGATNLCPAFRDLMLDPGVYFLKIRLFFPGNFDHEYYMDVTLR